MVIRGCCSPSRECPGPLHIGLRSELQRDAQSRPGTRCRPRLVRNCARGRGPITTRGSCCAKLGLPACQMTTSCGYGSRIGARGACHRARILRDPLARLSGTTVFYFSVICDCPEGTLVRADKKRHQATLAKWMKTSSRSLHWKRSVSSCGRPIAMMRPRLMITTKSQSCSTSVMLCEDSRMVAPRRF